MPKNETTFYCDCLAFRIDLVKNSLTHFSFKTTDAFVPLSSLRDEKKKEIKKVIFVVLMTMAEDYPVVVIV